MLAPFEVEEAAFSLPGSIGVTHSALDFGEGECLVAPHRRAFDRIRGEARPIARTGTDEFERERPFGMDFDYPPEEWPPDGWFRVEEDLVTILDDVLGKFRADPDRVYPTGVSYGGFGAFDLAASPRPVGRPAVVDSHRRRHPVIPDLSRNRPAWILLLAALTLAACEPDTSGGQETASGDSPPVVDVTMVDYAFVAPDTIPSGWVTFRTTNEGEESHHFHLYRLPEDRTYEDYREERLVPRDSIMRALATGTMDSARAREVYSRAVSDWTRTSNMEMKGGAGLLAPGRTGETTLRLEPGEYVMNCSVQTAGGQRHWQLGMVWPITVSVTSTEATPPEPDVTIRVSGRDLITEGGLTAGIQTVRFVVDRVSAGVEDSVYYAWLARLDGDTGVGDLLEWETRSPAPAEYLGGFWYIPVDQSAYVTVDLTPGRYAWDWGYFRVEHSGEEFTVE